MFCLCTQENMLNVHKYTAILTIGIAFMRFDLPNLPQVYSNAQLTTYMIIKRYVSVTYLLFICLFINKIFTYNNKKNVSVTYLLFICVFINKIFTYNNKKNVSAIL